MTDRKREPKGLSPHEQKRLKELNRRVQEQYRQGQANDDDDDERMALVSKLLSWLRRQP